MVLLLFMTVKFLLTKCIVNIGKLHLHKLLASYHMMALPPRCVLKNLLSQIYEKRRKKYVTKSILSTSILNKKVTRSGAQLGFF